MPLWFQLLRWVHIFCGMLAFFVAPVAMATLKGGPVHRKAGKIYFWMMAVVGLTAIIMAVYRPIVFLALVAVFSFYFAFRGYRVLQRKHDPAPALDWIVALVTLAGSAGLIVIGGLHPSGVAMPAPIVSIAFGGLGAFIAGIDVHRFLRPSRDKNAWWYSHMGGMLGSYIAAVSAFSAVNFHFLPPAIRWLWPSVIGVPAIFIWIGYYRRKFDRRRTAAVPA